jgi:hypothetical protein
LSLNGEQNYREDADIEGKLEADIVEYEKEGNLLKALKRSFSLLLLQDKPDKRMIQSFFDFFNSDAGLLYNIEYYYGLIDLLKKQKPIPKDIVKYNIAWNDSRLNHFGIKKGEIRGKLNEFALGFIERI